MILLASLGAYVPDTHRDLGLLPLGKRCEMHLAFLCHKTINFDGVFRVAGICVPVIGVTDRFPHFADTNAIKLPSQKNKKGQCAFSFYGSMIWSSTG